MAAAPLPLFLRRLRALLRPLAGGGRIDGFVDGCVAGEIRGWAMDPGRPNRRVHVVAVSDGRVVAEALADISRADLLQDGRGDGRHAFRLRLPAALLDGGRRTVKVQAIAGGRPVRLLRGEVEIKPPEEDGAGSSVSRLRATATAPGEIEQPSPRLLVALWPGEGEAPQGLDAQVVRLGGGAADEAMLSAAHTVIFAAPGDRIDPMAADILLRSRPLADVITWDGPDAVSRRPEARALGLRLGESLDGRFALRGHVLPLAGRALIEALAAADRRGAELALVQRPELRWAHLPGRLAISPAQPFARAEPETPSAPDRISLAVWPNWSPEAARSLAALIAQVGGAADLEVLVESSGAEEARRLAGSLGRELAVRAVDAPASAKTGNWLASLTAAAPGKSLVLCQAGVRLGGPPGAIEQIAAWAISPGVGTVTVEIRGAGDPLAGLGLARSVDGWAARSAYVQELSGTSRPVLGAPAAFLAIGRDRLAMLGGPADHRLPAGGADLDLALRLRRIGLAGVLVGGLSAEAEPGVALSGEIAGVPLAAFDPIELAAAAAAWPAPASR